MDAVSWRIIAEDLEHIYKYLLKSNLNLNFEELTAESILGVKGTSYRQWVHTVRGYKNTLSKDDIHDEQSYWKNQLAGIEQSKKGLLKLRNRNGKINFNKISLTKQETSDLLLKSSETYNTSINDLLLTALSRALAAVTQQNENHIVLEGHGRESEIRPLLVAVVHVAPDEIL